MKKFLFVAAALIAATFIGHSQPAVPKYVVYAGDTVRLNRPDRQEKMDRELLSFAYMHSNSTLILKRADRMFRTVVPILRKHGIPEDLKYLMVIESNLDPKAVSTAGAAGLWQFTKATAQHYGLEITATVDERYNIEKATVAACKYLKEAHDRYGNWMTVAASYNGGQNGINRKLESQRQKNAMDLWLVDETARYMYRVMACKIFFQNPESFGFHISPEECYPYIPPKTVVTVKEGIEDLVGFALEHGVSYADLKWANLWLRDSRLDNKSGKEYKIIIPNVLP